MNSYEKIRTKDGKLLILKNPREIELLGHPALTGTKCDREGDTLYERYENGELVTVEQVCVVDLALVGWRRPMLMSLHYGELVYMNGKP